MSAVTKIMIPGGQDQDVRRRATCGRGGARDMEPQLAAAVARPAPGSSGLAPSAATALPSETEVTRMIGESTLGRMFAQRMRTG